MKITKKRLRRAAGWTLAVALLLVFVVWVLSMAAGHAGS